MGLSLSQMIGVASVGGVVLMALGFLSYATKRISYLFQGPLRTAVLWGIIALIVQSILLLAISFDG